MLESHETPSRAEVPPPPVERLFVNEARDEYIDVDRATAQKVEFLLEHNLTGVDDLEALFAQGDKIQGANCHKTALYLTGEYSEEQLLASDNDSPETAGHSYIEGHSNIFSDTKQFEDALRRHAFPFRISFFKDKDGKPFAYHSITVVGVSSKGRLVAFEKEGPYADNPFRYTDASSTLSAYLLRGHSVGISSS